MKLLHVLKDTLPLVEIVGVTEDTVDVASVGVLLFPKKKQRDTFKNFLFTFLKKIIKLYIFISDIDA